ncbi:DMT family transporter [Actinomyces mediterranea]|uniref:DMT family transporter n=1 Tax=Actinomyces mediterranea TaxID=1871028 RepID=UPI00097100ED|nr:DMT family transporter [Actinomyces mediterranea]
MLFLFASTAVGFLMPLQTAINSRLRRSIGSPFGASLVSFAVGTFVLVAVVLALLGVIDVVDVLALATSAPWWMWIGGALGVIMLTLNILMFPRLGGIETALWPLLGQVLASVAIDAFGWFGVGVRPVTAARGMGVLVVLVGIAMATGLLNRRSTPAGACSFLPEGPGKWLWRITGFLGGIVSPVQSAINSALGRYAGSAVVAALVSFLVGTGVLVLIVAGAGLTRAATVTMTRPREDNSSVTVGAGKDAYVHSTAPSDRRGRCRPGTGPWWMWIGGAFGAAFVTVMAAAVPVIGTGPAMLGALTGQSAASVAVDRFGWLKAPRKWVAPIQLLGIIVMLAGVAAVQFG